MNKYRLMWVAAFLLIGIPVPGQDREKTPVEVDYANPKEYVVGGVDVAGNHHFSSSQIISLTGLQKGMRVTVPSDDLSSVVNRLWLQRYFENVSLEIDHLSAEGDSAFFTIRIVERPRVSRWSFTGVRKSEEKDLQERLNLRRGGEFSDHVSQTSVDIIRRFYSEKGFLQCEVEPQTQRDTIIKNAIRVNFAVDRGPRVRIKDIRFIGNTDVSDFKLARSMKKTKSNKLYNFFSSKNLTKGIHHARGLISAFNEAGYRCPDRKGFHLLARARKTGNRTYDRPRQAVLFQGHHLTGNSVHSADELNSILQLRKAIRMTW